MPGHPDIAKLRENIQTTPGSIQVDWKAAGPLHHLSDAMAAMYRKALNDDVSAREAWEMLTTRYRRDGKIPTCMNLDLTKVMKDSLARP